MGFDRGAASHWDGEGSDTPSGPEGSRSAPRGRRSPGASLLKGGRGAFPMDPCPSVTSLPPTHRKTWSLTVSCASCGESWKDPGPLVTPPSRSSARPQKIEFDRVSHIFTSSTPRTSWGEELVWLCCRVAGRPLGGGPGGGDEGSHHRLRGQGPGEGRGEGGCAGNLQNTLLPPIRNSDRNFIRNTL